MMFQKDYFFSYFYCYHQPIVGHFYILNLGSYLTFFVPPQFSCIIFLLKRELKILNPACNISALILVGPTSHLFILKLSSYILIPSKEDTV